MLTQILPLFVQYMNGRAELDVWHLGRPGPGMHWNSDFSSFSEYLALEDRLFDQLDELVYQKTGPVGNDLINRYKRGSLSDPERWPRNWNRSYEMPLDAPRASVLLLHGLSDSPYSLRSLAERLHDSGAHTLGLRIPGHGTAPSGLVKVSWQDMAAGYAWRCITWQIRTATDPSASWIIPTARRWPCILSLPRWMTPPCPDRQVCSDVARNRHHLRCRDGHLASAAGTIAGFGQTGLEQYLPEYEPFKYGSFAVNAGDLPYRLTTEIQRRITELQKSGKVNAMPPVLAFSSVVDSTVLAPALVSNLFNRLPAGGLNWFSSISMHRPGSNRC